jgi:serine/threonine protein kinase
MADIYLARGEGVAGVERYCVLKRILRERADDTQLIQMFLDEARLAAQLQHPNIASVHDVGKLGDSYFFTMEYVHGETVRSLLQRLVDLDRKLPLACALTIVAGTAAGLHHAHERTGIDGRPLGIVHRDVSPSNLMVSYEGNIKVVDFGVAKATRRAIETRSGQVKGKISYLSPEQCRGAPVDRRSDLFSLGIVMWELLTCDRLYRRDSDFANMTAITSEVPVPPSALRPDVPREVDDMVLRLLAKPAGERFQTAAAVVDWIEAFAVQAGILLSPSSLGRFIRDLFGHRPEPWLRLKTAPVAVESVAFASSTSSGTTPLLDIEVALDNVTEISIAAGPVEPQQLEHAPMQAVARGRSSTDTSIAPRRRRTWWLVAGVVVTGTLVASLVMRMVPGAPSTAEPAIGPTPALPERGLPRAPQVPPDEPVGQPLHPDRVVESRDDVRGVAEPDAAPGDPPVVAATQQSSPPPSPRPTKRRKPPSIVRPQAPPRPQATAEERAAFSSCTGGVMSGARALDCVRLACRNGAADKAFKWVAYVPAAQRGGVVAPCNELGIDLTTQTLDCTANPAACP